MQADSVLVEQNPHYEHYFAHAGDDFRYIGANSCLVKSPRLQQAEVRTPVIPAHHDWELTWKSSSKNYGFVLTYLEVIQPLYPILDPTLRFLAPEVPYDLTPGELFCLNMVYSIACYLEPDTNRKTNPNYVWNRSGRLDFHHFASEKYRKWIYPRIRN